MFEGIRSLFAPRPPDETSLPRDLRYLWSRLSDTQREQIKGEIYCEIPALPTELEARLLDEVNTGELVVSLLNDDKTEMVFVTQILEQYFLFDFEEALELTMQIHNDGKCELLKANSHVAGELSQLVTRVATDNGYPLKCIVEPANRL